MKPVTKYITLAAMIAAVYAVLTIILAPISFGPLQVRIAEAMTVLPFFYPQAIPGLYIGCMVANIYGGYGPIDIFGGSAITLLAALLTFWLRRFKKLWLAPLPPIVLNAFGVGYYLHILTDTPVWLCIGSVALGQFVSCFVLGLILLYIIKKRSVR